MKAQTPLPYSNPNAESPLRVIKRGLPLMTRHLLHLKKLSVIHLSILMVGLSAMTGEVRAAHDIYEGAIRHAEGEIANSGEAAAAARAKVFAREICRRLVPEIHNSTDAKRFLDRYDQVQQEREQGVSEVRRILREVTS